jgi:hypothetical protein
MTQLSPQKRKKRRQQLRDAQRRRRTRLKHEQKSFLQIILTDDLLNLLRGHSERCGKPMHIAAAELLHLALQRPEFPMSGIGGFEPGEERRPVLEGAPAPDIYNGQLDLFD